MVVFTDTAKVSPQVVWNTCVAPMEWESWDPDIQGLLDLSGGCETGTRLTFHMKDGAKYPAVLNKVVKQEFVSYTAKLLGGTVVIDGSIKLQKVDQSEEATRITYSFQLKGLLGGLVGSLKSKLITDGTRDGLQNIIRLSEQASSKRGIGDESNACGAKSK